MHLNSFFSASIAMASSVESMRLASFASCLWYNSISLGVKFPPSENNLEAEETLTNSNKDHIQ